MTKEELNDEAPESLMIKALVELLAKKKIVSIKDINKAIEKETALLKKWGEDNPEIKKQIMQHLEKQQKEEGQITNYIG